jgi:hypothetical protein
MHIHISDLELYLRCPRAYKLHQVDGIEPQHTTLSLCKSKTVRQVIYELHSGVKPLSEFTSTEIEKLCEDVWKHETTDPSVDKSELAEIAIQAKPETKTKPAIPAITKAAKALDEIKTWVIGYARLEKDSVVLYSNMYFEDEIGDCTFAGRIDLIRKSQDSIEIVMFKTGSQPPSIAYLARDFLTSLASHAVWQGRVYPDVESEQYIELRKLPVTFCYYLPYLEPYKRKNGNVNKGDLKGNPVIPVTRSEKTLLDFEYEILHAASGIETQYFPMNVTNILGCSICQYAEKCQTSAEPKLLEQISEVYETVVD